MKTGPACRLAIITGCLSILPVGYAATAVWVGGGADNDWQTGANWDGSNPPSPGDSLVFAGGARTTNTNNFIAGSLFNGFSFDNAADAFTLRGNPITLAGGITNNQAVLPQTVNIPLALNTTAGVNVVAGGLLSLGGSISGAGAGLSLSGFGGLTLSGANTYTGPTTVHNGTVTLDFTQATSPTANIISPTSSLILGEAGAGAALAGPAMLVVNGGTGDFNSQAFNGAVIDTGAHSIMVNSGSNGAVNLALGSLTHAPGGVVTVVTPALRGGLGNVTTTTSNSNGILGGWAIVGDGTNLFGITLGTNWASADAKGNIISYTGFTNYTTGAFLHNFPAGSNVRIDGTAVTNDVTVDTDGAGTTTDINTIDFNPSRPLSLIVGTNNILRLGRFGGMFKSDMPTVINWELGSSSGGADGLQNVGTLTAGGAPNTPGEIVVTLNSTSEISGSLDIDVGVTDNGNGAVTFVKAGPGTMKFRGHNSYSGGTCILQGRVIVTGSEIGTANSDGCGTGPVYIRPGGQLFAASAVMMTNTFYIAGVGVQESAANHRSCIGVFRLGNGQISGDVMLTGDCRIGGDSATAGISGRITGPFNLELGATQTVNMTLTLFNPNNDWTGNTTLNARSDSSATQIFRNGAGEVIPNGPGKGNVILNGNTGSGTVRWDLSGFNETINGLLSVGNPAGCVIRNSAASTTSILTVGDNNQSATFEGAIQSSGGIMALTKIGAGIQTLTGINTYTGDTVVSGGTLALAGSGSISGSTNINIDAGATLDVNGRIDGTLSLVGGQTLRGNGTVSGRLIAASGSTVSPGASVGVLTVSSDVILAGTTCMEVDRSLGTNDQLRANGSSSTTIIYGGTLLVTNIGGAPFAVGDSFKLFDATNYAGSFSSIQPAVLGTTVIGGNAFKLVWDTSQLTVSGTLKVAAAVPAIGSITYSGTNVVISGVNSPFNGASFYILQSTNVAAPLDDWTPLATNVFGPGGTFTFTNALDPNTPQQFFRLQVP